MKCLFCSIVAKEIKSEIVYEDEKTLAFLDIRPKSPGHTMVIPKVHAENIIDLPESEIQPLFRVVKLVTQKINQALNPRGFTIGINHGKVSGQAIDHVHVHIIPRFEADGGSSIHSVVDNPPKESVEAIGNKIRRFISE